MRKFVALGLSVLAALMMTLSAARAAWPGNDPNYEPSWDRIKRAGKLVVGCVPELPYASLDTATGDWVGLHTLMAADLAKELGVKWECVSVTWATAALAIQSGKVDVVLTLSASPQRATTITFAGPVYQQSYMMVNRPGLTGETWEAFNRPDVRVAIVVGTTNEQVLKQVMPKATMVGLAPNSPPALAVSAGRADAFLSSLLTGTIAVAKNPNLGAMSIPTPLVAFPGYVGVRNEPDKRFADFIHWWAEWNRLNGTIEGWTRQSLIGFGVPAEKLPPKLNM